MELWCVALMWLLIVCLHLWTIHLYIDHVIDRTLRSFGVMAAVVEQGKLAAIFHYTTQYNTTHTKLWWDIIQSTTVDNMGCNPSVCIIKIKNLYYTCSILCALRLLNLLNDGWNSLYRTTGTVEFVKSTHFLTKKWAVVDALLRPDQT